jgi:hypothetical protein
MAVIASRSPFSAATSRALERTCSTGSLSIGESSRIVFAPPIAGLATVVDEVHSVLTPAIVGEFSSLPVGLGELGNRCSIH